MRRCRSRFWKRLRRICKRRQAQRDAVGIGEQLFGGESGARECRGGEAERSGGAGTTRVAPRVDCDVMVIAVGGEEAGAGVGALREIHAELGAVERIAAREIGDAKMEVAPRGAGERLGRRRGRAGHQR